MRSNLVSISYLDDKNIHFHSRNAKCIIKFNMINVCIAIRQNKLYLLCHCDHVNETNTTSSMNICNVSVKHKQNKNESLSKLWHCRFGHISRGGLNN